MYNVDFITTVFIYKTMTQFCITFSLYVIMPIEFDFEDKKWFWTSPYTEVDQSLWRDFPNFPNLNDIS